MTLGVALALAVGVLASAQPVAYVNGEPITRDELDRATRLSEIVLILYQSHPAFAQALLATPEGKAFLARYERDVLEGLILRRLGVQEALRRGLSVDEGEVARRTEASLREVRARYGFTEEAFRAYLESQGFTPEGYREEVARWHREELLLAALRLALAAEIRVTDEEVRAYYEEDPGRFVDEEGNPLTVEEVYERIVALLRQDKADAHWWAWLEAARREAVVEITL